MICILICSSDKDRLAELVLAYQYEARVHGSTHVKEVREEDVALLVREGARVVEQPYSNAHDEGRLYSATIYYKGCAFRHSFVVANEETAPVPPPA